MIGVECINEWIVDVNEMIGKLKTTKITYMSQHFLAIVVFVLLQEFV